METTIKWQRFADAAPPVGGDHHLLISKRFHAPEMGWFYQGQWCALRLHGPVEFQPESDDLWAEVSDPQVYPTPA